MRRLVVSIAVLLVAREAIAKTKGIGDAEHPQGERAGSPKGDQTRKGWKPAASPTAAVTPGLPWIPDPPFVETRATPRPPTAEAIVFQSMKPQLVSVTAQRPADKGGMSQGSAFVIHASGLLLTSFHVVQESDEILVRFSEGEPITARVAGVDASLDLAVLRIDPPRTLTAAVLGDSDAAREGDPILAMGMPFGIGPTITRGILSGKDRKVDVGTMATSAEGHAFLQTDAAINPGSSGGPILDIDGRVIGVTTATIPAAKGISFATPINAAKSALPKMLREAGIGHAWLGLTLGSANGGGAEVIGVRHGGPADRAGLMTGDIVTQLRGKSIATDSDVSESMRDIAVHETIGLLYRRKGKVVKVEITAGEVPVVPVIDNLILGGALLSEFKPDSPASVTAGRHLGAGSGVFFDSVPKGCAAERSGIEVGDVLMVMGIDNVGDLDDVRVILDRFADSEAVKVLVRRGNRQFTAIVPR